MSILNALKGIGNEFEVQRIIGATGTLVYIVVAPLFIALGWIVNVSITEFCLAYPGGLAACLGATAGAIALKDRQVSAATVIQRVDPDKGAA